MEKYEITLVPKKDIVFKLKDGSECLAKRGHDIKGYKFFVDQKAVYEYMIGDDLYQQEGLQVQKQFYIERGWL